MKDFVAAAAFLAAVAYPTEHVRRDKFMRACMRWRRNEWKHRDNMSTIRLAARRIAHRRVPAATTALSLVMWHATTRPAKQSPPVGRIYINSVNAAMRAFSPAARAREDSMKTIWIESKPVLHLALALHPHFLGPDQVQHVLDLLERPEWVRGALDRANHLLKLLAATPSIRFTPSAAIVLVPA